MKANIWILLLVVTCASCGYDDSFTNEFDEQENEQGSAEEGFEGGENALTLYTVQGEDISKKQEFNVSGKLLPLQQDYGKHIKIWEFLKRVIPAKERNRIGELMVFYGNDDLAGYVEPINENDLSSWRFGLAIEIAENLEEIDFENFFTYVTIHEFGHIVSLNESQVDVTVQESSCNNYFPGEGCSKSKAYVNGIYDLGWSDIYDGEESEEDFYGQYPDRFVSEYAATNPAEDIAEVFSFFITKDEAPSGNSIADQKIQLLYEYPELVKLRNQMRENPVLRAMPPGSWKQNPYINKYRIGKNHKHHNHSALN